MKCRVCNFEVGNSFQLVCDSCTRREEELERQEEEYHYLDSEVIDCLEGKPSEDEFAEAKRQKRREVKKQNE